MVVAVLVTFDDMVCDIVVVKLVEALLSGVVENVNVHVDVLSCVSERVGVAVGDLDCDTV